MPPSFPYQSKTTFHGIPSSSAVEEYITKKLSFLEKLLAHYAAKGSEVLFEVEVGKTTDHHREGDVYRAEINFSAGGVHLRAEATKDDLYAALDEAKDEMQRELRRHKDKEMARVKRGGREQKKISNSPNI
ncbi:MAG: ribosome-associated translation inhibitor RaiA [Parcubacteria group bacterium]|nr:ribosome-associated translation inhibitor RaiA [Parcubacteria group bacterium]MBI3074942.1 ribosome-associated translation inhibitor RaiA [Parcubacteria group bacterium]